MARYGNEGLDHVAIGVADVERSRRFYAEVLGLERAHEAWDVPVVMAANGTGVAIFSRDLHPSTAPDGAEPPAIRILHIAFRVDREGLERARTELAERGLEVGLLRPRDQPLDLLRGPRRAQARAHHVRRLVPGEGPAFEAVVERVRELRAGYDPPDFGHVPDADAALFLCAMDHRTGYASGHLVEGRGPFEGSELLWEAGLRSARARPGLLTAGSLAGVSAEAVARTFEVDGDTVADPERRAALWRDLAAGLLRDHGGRAGELLAAADGRLGGDGGLLARLAAYEAYADPLAKKSQLFAKICARRGWFEVADPERWEVSADNVLMRLALRSGLVIAGRAGRRSRRDPGRLEADRHGDRDLPAAARRHALGAGPRRSRPARLVRRRPARARSRPGLGLVLRL